MENIVAVAEHLKRAISISNSLSSERPHIVRVQYCGVSKMKAAQERTL